MRTIVMVCLLGAGLLLPTAKVKSSVNTVICRIVDVNVQQDILLASSDAQTGGITKVKVYDADEVLVLTQQCGGGYSCEVDISGLHSGNYTAQVITTLTTYTEGFSVR